jgi:hypothetical protein
MQYLFHNFLPRARAMGVFMNSVVKIASGLNLYLVQSLGNKCP